MNDVLRYPCGFIAAVFNGIRQSFFQTHPMMGAKGISVEKQNPRGIRPVYVLWFG